VQKSRHKRLAGQPNVRTPRFARDIVYRNEECCAEEAAEESPGRTRFRRAERRRWRERPEERSKEKEKGSKNHIFTAM
jgi:hypothetical protein